MLFSQVTLLSSATTACIHNSKLGSIKLQQDKYITVHNSGLWTHSFEMYNLVNFDICFRTSKLITTYFKQVCSRSWFPFKKVNSILDRLVNLYYHHDYPQKFSSRHSPVNWGSSTFRLRYGRKIFTSKSKWVLVAGRRCCFF